MHSVDLASWHCFISATMPSQINGCSTIASRGDVILLMRKAWPLHLQASFRGQVKEINRHRPYRLLVLDDRFRNVRMGPSCAWPASLSALFTEANWTPTDHDASELRGPYNALLDFYFPWEEGWNVVPQFRRPRQGDTLDFITVFLVTRQKIPFLFLEVKPASHLEGAASRAVADDHMRDVFLALAEARVTVLHGFSALGSRLRHYSLNTATGELSPHQIPKDPRFLTDTAPATAWSLDILCDEGDKHFQTTVDQIKRDLEHIF